MTSSTAYQPGRPGGHLPNYHRKIEAVTVCVNYADFLVQILPHIRGLFDRLVVVTTPADTYTQRVCEYYRVECIQTNDFYQDGAVFNKAKGINRGLEVLDKDGWVVHLDADVYLPPWTRDILNRVHLDERAIYGIDRLMCHSYEAWVNFLAKPTLMHEQYYLVQPWAFPIGSRVAHYNADGYFPIGFFQLWNPLQSGIIRYPENSVGADHTDVVFSKAFAEGKRHLLPEFYGIHLDSERKAMGVNWNGRKTAPFCLNQEKVLP